VGKLLTAALIVKDEEKHLAACLRTIAGIVDEIVVVDTGSSDHSRQIAASNGARVFEYFFFDAGNPSAISCRFRSGASSIINIFGFKFSVRTANQMQLLPSSPCICRACSV